MFYEYEFHNDRYDVKYNRLMARVYAIEWVGCVDGECV